MCFEDIRPEGLSAHVIRELPVHINQVAQLSGDLRSLEDDQYKRYWCPDPY